jgi:hypothetical protein
MAVCIVIWMAAAKGYSSPDIGALVAAKPSLVPGALALLFWVWRYYPPAVIALWDGPHLVTANSRTLFLPQQRELPLTEIVSVDVHRSFWRKSVDVRTSSEVVSFSALFVPEADDEQLRQLA